MKAITVDAWWAWGLASGLKRVENRRWRSAHRGLLAIHAGGNRAPLVKGWEAMELPTGEKCGDAYVFGAVVAVVDLIDCVDLDTLPDAYRKAPVDYFDPCGPVCWCLANARRLARPVACKGAQKLWTLPADVLRAVEEQLAAGAVMVTK